jgi:hypothetical protein
MLHKGRIKTHARTLHQNRFHPCKDQCATVMEWRRMPRKAMPQAEGSDSPQSRKGMVKEAAGRRGIVINPNLLEIVGRSDGGAKARFPLRRGSGKWIPCRPFGVLGWGAARQSVLATLGGEAGIRRVRFAGDHRGVARRRRGDRRGVPRLATTRYFGADFVVLRPARV